MLGVEQTGFDACESKPASQLVDRVQPMFFHVTSYDPATIAHQLGQISRLPSWGSTEVQDTITWSGRQRGRGTHSRLVLDREPSVGVTWQVGDGSVFAESNRQGMVARFHIEPCLYEGRQQRLTVGSHA